MNREKLINKFIQERGFTSYLELGVQNRVTFDNINCTNKKCVDLVHPADYQMSTDDFFEINKDKYDIIFIDANHTEPYLTRDIKNSLQILNKNGVIVLHDVNPPDEFYQIDSNMLCQTAWKAFVKFRFLNNSNNYLTYSYPTDYGLGVIDTSKLMEIKKNDNLDYDNLEYKDLEKHREHFLGFI